MNHFCKYEIIFFKCQIYKKVEKIIRYAGINKYHYFVLFALFFKEIRISKCYRYCWNLIPTSTLSTPFPLLPPQKQPFFWILMSVLTVYQHIYNSFNTFNI